jgi:hypothetical protein
LLHALDRAPRLAKALTLLPLDAAYTVVASRRSLLGRLVPDRPGPRRR